MPTLNWLTRDEDTRATHKVPYRLLEESTDLSYGDKNTGNMLIQGDNLEALKTLLPFYAGQVKCIYIDPPYNTQSAFEYYDDNIEHSKWLAMMWPRLELLREFLAEDGSIWVSIDDNEAHYLKVIMDEIFGRKNFMANVIWNSTKSVTNTAIVSVAHTNTLLYFKEKDYYVKNRTDFRLPETGCGFSNPDNDPRGPWKADPFQVGGWRPNQQYEITNPITGQVYTPKKCSSWKNDYNKFQELLADGRIIFGKTGRSGPQRKRFQYEAEERGRVMTTLWIDSETTTDGTRHSKKLFGENSAFTNPKPESLIEKIFQISTNPDDLILDSFLGSGTTVAVAHKMKRRYIGIEMGDHAVSHCATRLAKVVDGEVGGISENVNWKGGGGFHFYCLGSTVFNKDGCIQHDIKFSVLAAHVWFSETNFPWSSKGTSPFLGIHDGCAYILLYNGILGDKRPNGGNVLTRIVLHAIKNEIEKAGTNFDGSLVIYGEQSRLTESTLEREGIIFKQTPYDIKIRS